MRFGPPTKMHLRNLIYTYKAWVREGEERKVSIALGNVENDDAQILARCSTGYNLLDRIDYLTKRNIFEHLPEGV